MFYCNDQEMQHNNVQRLRHIGVTFLHTCVTLASQCDVFQTEEVKFTQIRSDTAPT